MVIIFCILSAIIAYLSVEIPYQKAINQLINTSDSYLFSAFIEKHPYYKDIKGWALYNECEYGFF